MGRKRSHTPLAVFMNARQVGLLERNRGGAVSFAYTADWLGWEHALPVSLSLPLREDRYVGAPVLAVFDNLLPDHDAIRKRIAERVGASGMDIFSLLSEIGRDCVGALQLLPDGEAPTSTDRLTGVPLSDEQIEALLKDLGPTPLGIRQDRDFRISIAGAQEKTALLRHKGQWVLPSGTTPTTHIFKPRIGHLPNGLDLTHSVENEYLCLKLLKAFGLQVAHAEMATFGDHKALVVERFDRQWTPDGRLIRVPQEDCCQALSVPPGRKYQSEGGPGVAEILPLLLGSDEPARDRADFLKAVVLFWLIGATDGHAKNFSLFLTPGGFRMAPLYDVLTVQPTVDAGRIERKTFRLAMCFGKSRHYRVQDISKRHIVESAIDGGLSPDVVFGILDELVAMSPAAIDTVLGTLPAEFPVALTDSVVSALKSRLALLR